MYSEVKLEGLEQTWTISIDPLISPLMSRTGLNLLSSISFFSRILKA